jgi:predicted lipid carrier protein YhbT
MLPPILSTLAVPLPLPFVQRIAQASLVQVIGRHPDLFDRLGSFAERPITICPTDAPFEFTLMLARRAVRTSRRGARRNAYATRISGPLVMLLALAEGRLDGDAEFFGRKITIEGDMETALALRNAAESSSLDLVRDLTPDWGWAQRPGQLLLGALRRSLLAREGLPCN